MLAKSKLNSIETYKKDKYEKMKENVRYGKTTCVKNTHRYAQIFICVYVFSN